MGLVSRLSDDFITEIISSSSTNGCHVNNNLRVTTGGDSFLLFVLLLLLYRHTIHSTAKAVGTVAEIGTAVLFGLFLSPECSLVMQRTVWLVMTFAISRHCGWLLNDVTHLSLSLFFFTFSYSISISFFHLFIYFLLLKLVVIHLLPSPPQSEGKERNKRGATDQTEMP